MFGEITQQILQSIETHRMLAVIIGVAIETIIVPLPSPLIVMAAGSIMIKDGPLLSIILSALWISVVAGLAQTIGSYLLYLIGYYGGKPVIDRYERLHGVSWEEIENFQDKFTKNKKESITLFILRALPIMPLSVISGVAGILKMDFKKYTVATFSGVIPRNFMLAISGYMFSGFYRIIAERIDHAETIMTAIIVLLIIIYIVANKFNLFEKIQKKIIK